MCKHRLIIINGENAYCFSSNKQRGPSDLPLSVHMLKMAKKGGKIVASFDLFFF